MISSHVTELNESATKREWDKFIDLYRRNPAARNAVITNSDETPLHVALSRSAAEHVVEAMLDILDAQGVVEAYECLKMADKEGNTAFHLAASKGYAGVCRRIANVDERNKNGKLIPLGSKFIPLGNMTNVNGDNIFQVAFSNKHFDVAGHISNWYPYLVEKAMDIIRRKLFKLAMGGHWMTVVRIYSCIPAVHKARITKSGDTALHIAVSEGLEEVVQKLVEQLSKGTDKADVLKVRNKRGNTALHWAAALGNVKICKSIAKVDESLLSVRNDNNETPFFLAARHGKKDVFLHLHDMCQKCKNIQGSSYWRGKDGATILHAAIEGDYYDLAFQIIHLYEDLVNFVDEKGASPLHLLASKPSAFKSGSYFSSCQKLIYSCIFVEKLKVECASECFNDPQNHTNLKYPDNYKACVGVVLLVEKALRVIFGQCHTPFSSFAKGFGTKGSNSDSNRQSREDTNGSTRDLEKQEDDQSEHRHKLIPPNYTCCFDLVKLFSKALLVILGLGSSDIEKIREKRKMHTWAAQVMDKLLCRTTMYEYEFTGGAPYENEDGGDVSSVEAAFKSTPSDVPTIAEPSDQTKTTGETPAKNGIKEMVEIILNLFPVAIQDEDAKKKNNVLLAVENRQPRAYHVSSVQAAIHTISEPSDQTKTTRETPILIAAKNGIQEMVEKILHLFPVAIQDEDAKKKNIVLLAVENRQPRVYQFLVLEEGITMKESIFRKVDSEGNSALHLAAKLGDYKPWRIPGSALQMQWEIKWYEYVKKSMPSNFFPHQNTAGKTADDLFSESHSELVKSGGEWLTNTSQSCSVVAGLIATVAFATAATVPGGNNQESGRPVLESQPVFNVFSIASLVALCFSVTALVMFLSILTSRHQEKDFRRGLPRKLLFGLTSLFISIAAILVSFCAGHFFVLKDELRFAAYPVYVVTCLPVSFFAMAQFPLYFDLLRAFLSPVPERSYMVVGT